jgi:spermidine synthase
MQLAIFNLQADESAQVIAAQLRKPGLLASTRQRLQKQLDSARANVEQLNALLEPMLTPEATGVDDDAPASDPDQLEPLLAHFELLLRDWGWSDDLSEENARALALVRDVWPESPGRVLVLGPGACRLAYDLHRTAAPESTTALDVDVLLLGVARRMLEGGELRLTEAPSDVNRLAKLYQDLVLRAPHGAVDDFELVFGDGLAPAFRDGSFDTVLTPWFIDQVPLDLRDFIGEIQRLLAPGGAWVNTGPLIYRPRTQVSNHFTIEEVTELAGLAGFEVERVLSGDWRYLCSPLKARGRYEISFAFRARRADPPGENPGGPPPWLVLTHLPVPPIPGSHIMNPSSQVVRAVLERVDGKRSINDLAQELGRRGNMRPADLIDAIRSVLADLTHR